MPNSLRPLFLVFNRSRYQDAREEADAVWANDILGAGKIEALLEEFLAHPLEG